MRKTFWIICNTTALHPLPPPTPPAQHPHYKDGGVSHQVAQLNRYLPKPKNKDGKYLVDSKRSAADAVEEKERKEKEEKEAAVAAPGADREVCRRDNILW